MDIDLLKKFSRKFKHMPTLFAKVVEDLNLFKLVGSGSNSSVYALRDDSTMVAVVTFMASVSEARHAKSVLDEINMCSLENIIPRRFKTDIYSHGAQNGVILVTLWEKLNIVSWRGWHNVYASAMHLAEALFTGLAAMHDSGICHRDISPNNVVLTQQGVRFIDLQSAHIELLSGRRTYLAGTRGFRAFEIEASFEKPDQQTLSLTSFMFKYFNINHIEQSKSFAVCRGSVVTLERLQAADVFALGMVLINVLTNQPNPCIEPVRLDNLSEEIQTFAMNIFNPNFMRRHTAQAALTTIQTWLKVRKETGPTTRAAVVVADDYDLRPSPVIDVKRQQQVQAFYTGDITKSRSAKRKKPVTSTAQTLRHSQRRQADGTVGNSQERLARNRIFISASKKPADTASIDPNLYLNELNQLVYSGHRVQRGDKQGFFYADNAGRKHYITRPVIQSRLQDYIM